MNIDTAKDDLLALAAKAASLAKGRVDAYEIFLSSSRSLGVSINGGAVAADDGETQGGGIRVAVGRRLGFASATGLDPEAMRTALTEAIAIAKGLGHEDKGFEGFAERRPAAREGPMDDALVGLGGGELVKRVSEVYDAAREVKPGVIRVEEAQATVKSGAYGVVNSSGVQHATRFAALVAWASTTAAEGDRRKTGSDFVTSRSLEDFRGVGASAAQHALAMLGAKPLGKVATMATLWDPVTAASLLETALGNSISGRSVHEGRSALKGKLGQPVGSKGITVLDDGQHPKGLAAAAIDMEGVPQGTTPILEAGVLRNFLYDHYFARLEGTRSTGNAQREGTEIFAATPRISSTTLVVKAGKGTAEDLAAAMDEGILVTDSVMGMGHANTISGDFSIVATNPFLIKGGEIAGALEPVSLAGNLYRCLADIERVGGDVRLVGGVLTPSLAIGGLTATG